MKMNTGREKVTKNQDMLLKTQQLSEYEPSFKWYYFFVRFCYYYWLNGVHLHMRWITWLIRITKYKSIYHQKSFIHEQHQHIFTFNFTNSWCYLMLLLLMKFFVFKNESLCMELTIYFPFYCFLLLFLHFKFFLYFILNAKWVQLLENLIEFVEFML